MPSLWIRFPGGKQKALTLSYDDGVEQDLRLIEIMNKNGLKGTFNLGGGLFAPEGTVYPKGQVHRRMTKSQALELYPGSGQEVAVHAMYHGDLPQLPIGHATWQVSRDREELENTFGCIVRGMAYPFGTVDPAVKQAMAACGIVYARTTISSERFSIPTNWLEWPATCKHTNPRLMELAKTFAEGTSPYPQLFYLWGHAYEFEGDDNWNVIEAFAEYMGGREDIWYATNIEIHDYVEAWRGMHISADGRRFYNPSIQTLWFSRNGQTYELAPGAERFFE